MTLNTLPPTNIAVPEAYVIACLVQGDWERALDLIAEMGAAAGYAPHLAAVAARLLAARDPMAGRVAESATEMDPHCGAAQSILGRSILAALDLQSRPLAAGRADKHADTLRAEAALRRAVELDRQDLPALVALAGLCTRQDRFPEARALVEQALALAPRDEAVREALKRLRKAVETALKGQGSGARGQGLGKALSPLTPDPWPLSPDRMGDRQPLTATLSDLRRMSAQLHQMNGSTALPSVSLCLITRDEARNLPRVIGSVRGLVTEIVVVDTGSVDETVKVAHRLGARVAHFDWVDDFAAARNHSLELATGEWILVLDADDEFVRETVQSLQQWLSHSPEAAVVGLYRRYPHPGMQRDSVSIQPRLFRSGRGFHFEGAVHEQLMTADGRIAAPDITLTAMIHHHGAIEGPGATTRRQERNGRILLHALEREPGDLRSRFYLGLTMFEAERWSEAVPHFQTVVERAGSDVDFVPKAYACLGNALLNTHRPFEAEETLRLGLARFPDHPELWFCRGLVLDHLGRLEDAIAANEAALRGQFGGSLNWHDWACREAKPHIALCDLTLTLGDPAAARRHLAAAKSFTGTQPAYGLIREAIERTEDETARRIAEREQRVGQLGAEFAAGDASAGDRLVADLLEGGQIASALAFVEEWLRKDGENPWAQLARGRALMASERPESALECFVAARRSSPDLTDAWIGEAAALREMKRCEEAEVTLLDALRTDPENDALNRGIGELYLECRRWDQAACHFQRILERRDDDGAVWLGLGKALLKLGKLPSAINCYQRAASLSGGGAAVRIALGEARAFLAREGSGSVER